jgi:hypothetical protein
LSSCQQHRYLLAVGSAVAVVATISIVGCAQDRDEETGAESAEVDVFDLQVGDCLADFQDATALSRVTASPCSEPHSDEIYASGAITDEDEFPGAEAIQSAAEDICIAEYAEFVGLPYEDSVLDIGYLTPTEESWATGDREVLCTIFDPAEEVTGSLRGAER